MEELIFIALIFIFSVIESIARKRKQQQGRARIPEHREPQPWEPQEWQPEPDETERRELPRESTTLTYDEEPSYDDLVTEETTAPRPRGSEEMIPQVLWEELAGLARRRRELEARPVPVETAPPAPPKKPLPAPARESWGIRKPRVGQSRIHLAHAEYGTDPSSRAPSLEEGLDPLARRVSADVRAVRRSLRGGRHALRRAVILEEVLGPPASLRPERFEE